MDSIRLRPRCFARDSQRSRYVRVRTDPGSMLLHIMSIWWSGLLGRQCGQGEDWQIQARYPAFYGFRARVRPRRIVSGVRIECRGSTLAQAYAISYRSHR
jgi:hypothetical protein